jgi:DNA-binding ferritin-like protein
MADVDLRLKWINETNNAIKNYTDATNASMGQMNALLQQHAAYWNRTGAAQQQTHTTIQNHVKNTSGVVDYFGKQITEVGARIAGAFALYQIEEFTRHAVLAYGKTERITQTAREIAQLNVQQMDKVSESLRKFQAQSGEKYNDLVSDFADFVARTRLEGIKASDIFTTVGQAAEMLGVTNENMTASISAAMHNLTLGADQAKEQLKQWEDILPGVATGFTKTFPEMARSLKASGFDSVKSGNQIAAMIKVLTPQFENSTQAGSALNEILNKALTNPNLYAQRQAIKAQGGGALELIQMQLDYMGRHEDDPEFFRRLGYGADAIVGMQALMTGLPEVVDIIKKAETDLEPADEKWRKHTSDFKGATDAAAASLDKFADILGKRVAPAVKFTLDMFTRDVNTTSSQMEGKKRWFDPSPSEIWDRSFKDFHILPRGSLWHADPSVRTPLSPAPPSAEQHQTGGIINQPTLTMLGETGPEAVIPMTELKQAAAAQARSEEQQKAFKELSTVERIHKLALRTPQLAGFSDLWKNTEHKPGATNWSGGDRQRMADGGVSIGPTDATIAEAGPEMRVNLNDPSKSTLVTRRTDVTLGKEGPEAIVPLGDTGGRSAEMPANARAFVSAIGSTETGFSYKEAYTDKYNQPGNNANVRKYGPVAADYGYYQMNRMDADEAVQKYGMDPMQARHLYGGVDQKSSVEDQTQAVNEYIKRRWPAQYQKMVDTGDFEGMRKTAQGTWFGLKDHQALARKEFQNPTLAKPPSTQASVTPPTPSAQASVPSPPPPPSIPRSSGAARRTAHMADGGLVLPSTPSGAGTLPLTSGGADIDKTIGGFQKQEWYIAGREYAASLIESLDGLRNHSPADKEKLKKFMAAGGERDADNGLNPMDEAWCAHTVRSAYRQAGLGEALGGTSPTASSFKNWQTEVKGENVQRGDVLLLPPTSERSGHVGVGGSSYDPATKTIPLAAGNQALPGQKYERSNPRQGEGGAASTVPLPVGGPELGPDRLLTARRAMPPIELRTPGPASSSVVAAPGEAYRDVSPIQVPIEPVVSTQAVMSARRQTARVANNFQGHADAQHARTAHGSPGHV